MDIHAVAQKLIGPVEPIGKTEVDAERYANLRELISLTVKLLATIERIALENADRVEASRKRAGVRCLEFLAFIAVAEQ